MHVRHRGYTDWRTVGLTADARRGQDGYEARNSGNPIVRVSAQRRQAERDWQFGA